MHQSTHVISLQRCGSSDPLACVVVDGSEVCHMALVLISSFGHRSAQIMPPGITGTDVCMSNSQNADRVDPHDSMFAVRLTQLSSLTERSPRHLLRSSAN